MLGPPRFDDPPGLTRARALQVIDEDDVSTLTRLARYRWIDWPDVVTALSLSGHSTVRQALAENTTVPFAQVAVLSRDLVWFVRRSLLWARSDIPLEVLERLAEMRERPEVRQWVAGSPSGRERLPMHLACRLAADDSAEVRAMAVEWCVLPRRTVERLLVDPDGRVAAQAAAQVDRQSTVLLAQCRTARRPEVLNSIAGRPDLTEALKAALLGTAAGAAALLEHGVPIEGAQADDVLWSSRRAADRARACRITRSASKIKAGMSDKSVVVRRAAAERFLSALDTAAPS